MDDSIRALFSFATPDHVALCTSSRQTFWRWKNGHSTPPLAVVNLLHIVAEGKLEFFGDAWDGWRMLNGQLCDRDGIVHTPATIQAWHWTAQQLQALRARENQLARELPSNAVLLPSARPAHALTEKIYRRLEAE